MSPQECGSNLADADAGENVAGLNGDGTAASAQPSQTNGQARERSSSSSSSSSRSSSGSSRQRSRQRAKTAQVKLVIDDRVEVFGLRSEGAQMLNGRQGVVLQYMEAEDKYEVSFGPGKVATIRPENLKKVDLAKVEAQAATNVVPKTCDTKPMSLAALLGTSTSAENPEDKKPAAYQPIWERTGTKAASGMLTGEQQEMFQAMQAAEEEREAEAKMIKDKVTAEFAAAGVFEEELVQQAYEEQLEQFRLNKLLRPQDFAKDQPKRSRSRSSSSSSSSGSRSRSRSRSRASK